MRCAKLLCCCLPLLLAVPATAQRDLAAIRVSIQAANRPIRDVLNELSRQTGVPITVDDRILDEPVSLDLKDQPLNRALDLVARSLGLVWYQRDGRVHVNLDPAGRVEVSGLGSLPAVGVLYPVSLLNRTVTAGYERVPLREVARRLQDATGATIVVDPTLPETILITATFRDTPLSRCLYLIGLAAEVYVRPEPGKQLHLYGIERVAVHRSDSEEVKVVRHYPDDYHGVIGFLVAPEIYADPGAYGVAMVADDNDQPEFVSAPEG